VSEAASSERSPPLSEEVASLLLPSPPSLSRRRGRGRERPSGLQGEALSSLVRSGRSRSRSIAEEEGERQATAALLKTMIHRAR
jgi:hypothetical protein